MWKINYNIKSIPKLLMIVNFRFGFEVWESVILSIFWGDCFSGVISDEELSDWFWGR